MNNATDQQIMEIRNLMLSIESLIEKDYSHVKELLPQGFYNSVVRHLDSIETELEKRDM